MCCVNLKLRFNNPLDFTTTGSIGECYDKPASLSRHDAQRHRNAVTNIWNLNSSRATHPQTDTLRLKVLCEGYKAVNFRPLLQLLVNPKKSLTFPETPPEASGQILLLAALTSVCCISPVLRAVQL